MGDYMTKKTRIVKTAADGFDRVEWLGADERVHRARADSPDAVRDVLPERLARTPPKFKGQSNFHGRYWCAGTGGFVFHESMTEYTGLMLLDHFHPIVAISAQPMLLSFANGRVHYPDFFAMLAGGRQLLVDVHLASLTTDEDREQFALTRQLCVRVGWDYQLIDELRQVAVWNIEWLSRYRHPRCRPSDQTRDRILRLAGTVERLGPLRRALATDKPGEHMPALYHLFWERKLLFDLNKRLNDETHIWVA
ncbi:TnsA-like heteromeric transposase endonuclease subunit [Microbacterium invictum]|nr:MULTISPECIES: TnsA-like heteromeric transposase endonuclease subunit [Microbacterium]